MNTIGLDLHKRESELSIMEQEYIQRNERR